MLAARPSSALTCLLDIRYAAIGGVDLCLDVLGPAPLPTSPFPVIVRIDGCPGWGAADRSSAMLPFANPALAQASFLTVAISVRHSGQAIFPAQLHDAQAAVRWLRMNPIGLPIDPDRIGVWGHSAGGHLAAMVGLTVPRGVTGRGQGLGGPRDQVQAVVTISGPSDFVRPGGAMHIDRPSPVTALVGGDVSTHLEQLRAASPLTHVAADAPPFLIIHGTSDETVPYDQAERLHRALLAEGTDAQLLPIGGGHHNLRDDPHAPYEEQVWHNVANEVVRFFRLRLLPPEVNGPRGRAVI